MIIQNSLAWGIIVLVASALLGITFGIQAAVFCLLAAYLAWWVKEYPEEAFLLFIVLSPLLPMLKATQTIGNITLVKDVLIITLFLRTFLIPLLTQSLPYRRNMLFAPIFALAAWSVFEVLNAGVTALSILRLRDIGLYMLLYFGVLYLPHSAKIMRTRLFVFLATLIVTALLGLLQFFFLPDSTVLRFDPERAVWIPRIASTFAHPTVFAEYLITGAVFLTAIAILRKTKKQYAFALLGLFGVAILVYFTYTRAGWIGFIAAILAMCGMAAFGTRIRPTRKTAAIAVVIAALVSAGIVRFTPVGTFLRSSIDPSYASNADRITFVVQLISRTSNSDAIWGKGLGNVISFAYEGGDATAFDIASGESRTIQRTKDQTLVDNQYIKTFIEMGIIGVVLTFWLFWRFALASWRSFKSNEYTAQIIGIAGIGFLASFIFQAAFVDIWDVFPTNAIFWSFAALISAVFSQSYKKPAHP